jgi:hypothetical protein
LHEILIAFSIKSIVIGKVSEAIPRAVGRGYEAILSTELGFGMESGTNPPTNEEFAEIEHSVRNAVAIAENPLAVRHMRINVQ